MDKLAFALERQSLTRQILISVPATYVLMFAVMAIVDLIDASLLNSDPQDVTVMLILEALVLGPVLDTLVFQTAFLLAVKKCTEISGNKTSWRPAFILTVICYASIFGIGSESIAEFLAETSIMIPMSISFTALAILQRKIVGGKPILGVIMLSAVISSIALLVIVFAVPT